MTVALPIEPLTAAAFDPFGDLVSIDQAERRPINDGMAIRHHDLARIDVVADGGVPILSVFHGLPWPKPVRIRMLERHPLGSQAFYPLGRPDWLVVVASGDDQPDLATLRCFRPGTGAGVNYRRGTWHHPLLVLDQPGDFLVIDRGGRGDNLQVARFADAEERVVSP